MKKALLIFCLLSNFKTIAQIQFKGIITEQNSGKKPIALANVKAEFANPIQSDSKGNFNLRFQGKNFGDEVSIQAQKDGFEVVNFKEMMTKIPKKQVAPFKIIMCKAGLVAQNRVKYYGISEKYITAKYERELAKLNRSTAGWEAKAEKLEKDFRANLEFTKELADRYSMMNLDDVTALQRKAFKLFEENKVEEAIKLLEGENYRENIQKVKLEQKKIQENTQLADEEIAKAEDVIQQQISKLMFQADLYAQDFQFDKAERTYEIAVEADSSNYDNTFYFAYFLQKQNQHDKAILYYQRALRFAKTEPSLALIQNNLGVLYQTNNRYSEALRAYNKALEIYERLVKINPAVYEPNVAVIQNNLGILYQDNNEYSEALKAYKKSLEIHKRFAKTNPAIHEPGLAMTENSLGGLYKSNNEYSEAFKAYNKALEIYERFAKTNPAVYEPNVAVIQRNFGILYQANNEYSEALKAYNKALEIYERFAKTNPTVYEPNVADTQNSLGILYQANNEYSEAFKAYYKALKIYERFAKTNPAAYEPNAAMIQNNLGALYQANNEYSEALKAYYKALEIYERFAKINPAVYEPNVADTQNSLGILYQANNEYSEALKAYNKALKIYEQFTKINSAAYEPYMAMIQRNLGILSQAKNEYSEALKAYNKALEIYERFAKTNLTVYEPNVADMQNSLGILYQANNEYSKALKAYNKALEIYERFAKTNPAAYEPYMAMIQNNLGALYQANNEYLESLKALTKSLEIYERFAKTNPAVYEPYMADTQNNLGILYQANNEYSEALKASTKALEIYERLVKTNPTVYEIKFCRSVLSIGSLQKVNYQEVNQKQIDVYLSNAKKILLKYSDIPLAKMLMKYIIDLEDYYKDFKILSPINDLEKQLSKAGLYSEKIKIRIEIIEKYRHLANNGYPKFANELGRSFGSLSFYQLFEKQFKAAEQSANEALNPTTFKKTEDYDAEIEWANTNLALALLFQGNYTEAEKIYLALKDKPYNKTTYKETFLADLEELEKAGIMHPDVSKIRELLKK